MSDDRTDAENKKSADEIKHAEATEQTPRGNVHSEPDQGSVDQDAPPPLPN
jgi:hypothetical protein